MFVLTSQIVTSPAMFRFLTQELYSKSVYFKAYITFYETWTLDFFCALYTPFCIHPNMTAMRIRALDYTVAVYPLLLVIISYVFAIAIP